MFIPISTDTSIRRTPWVNYTLILSCVVLYVLPLLAKFSAGGQAWAEAIHLWLSGGVLDGQVPRLYQFFTYQFLHANFAHLAGNMLFLWVFGNAVNAKMGHGPYLCFYLAGGIFAATVFSADSPHSLLGASGSIAAVTTAYLALFPRSHITILYWLFFIGTFELPSLWMIVFKLILWDNVLGPRWIGGDGAFDAVAYSAHLAGYAFGFVATAVMLRVHALPRDQFDILALGRRWWQRQGMRTVMADPNQEARARLGRVARPVTLDGLGTIEPAGQLDQFGELRLQIAQALAEHRPDQAMDGYERLLELDPRQALPRQQQLDIANYLYSLHRLPQSAAAYEKYLSQYGGSPEADQVRLLLGIIYARDLQQYEIAEGHLSQLVGRFLDERRESQCRHWLNIASIALGRGRLDPEVS